jgi:enoyl-[acyl-carrier-protein] reductase (NADH)
MASIVEKHHDTDVLETCAKTLELLCTDGNAIFTRCDVARSTLIDMVVNKYKEAVDDWRSLIEGVSHSSGLITSSDFINLGWKVINRARSVSQFNSYTRSLLQGP